MKKHSLKEEPKRTLSHSREFEEWFLTRQEEVINKEECKSKGYKLKEKHSHFYVNWKIFFCQKEILGKILPAHQQKCRQVPICFSSLCQEQFSQTSGTCRLEWKQDGLNLSLLWNWKGERGSFLFLSSFLNNYQD